MSMQVESRRPMAPKRVLPGRLAEEHPHLGEAARQHEVLDDLEKGALVVEVRLQIGGIDGDETLGGGGDFIDRGAYFRERGQDRQGLTVLPVEPGGATAARVGGIAGVGELRQRTVDVDFPGYCHTWRLRIAGTKGRLRRILVRKPHKSVRSGSRFGRAPRRQ